MEGLEQVRCDNRCRLPRNDGIGRGHVRARGKTKRPPGAGMSAWCYTGSYQVPVRTLTDGITKDIAMIEEIIGPAKSPSRTTDLTADLRRISPDWQQTRASAAFFPGKRSDQCPPWRRCKMYGADLTRHQRKPKSSASQFPPDP